ncbi:MAG: plasma-membrane proton-efflux P-type ATPase [Syntrophobacteraceae bacterium]
MTEPVVLSGEETKKSSPEDLFARLESSPGGISEAEAEKRLEQYGPNALEEKKQNLLLKFLSYFWGPIPWMIEVAALLSALVKHWGDLFIIVFLLVFNAVVGFWEEHEAGNALEALKSQLALKARVLRDGRWQEIEAKGLVPGDVIRVRLGDIIPADVKLVEGEYLSIDQSALTGESLPVNMGPGDIAYSGSIAKQGEMVALVTGTGGNTFFARTAKLVETAGAVSHFQKAVMKIGNFLIIIAVALSIILVVVELHRRLPVLTLVEFVLILVVASIPVAMPAVLSVTMALGALALSKMKAIVSRLESIEEMAGIDVLCSDKTGTLTLNQLTMGEPITSDGVGAQDLILAGSLASKEENRDAIDLAVLEALQDKNALQSYELIKFSPFDPIRKRTEATVRHNGEVFKVSKGAPQIIIQKCVMDEASEASALKAVDELAAKGYRTLGVARSEEDGSWKFLGLLPLFDPPRPDAKETIAEAQARGIEVKMVTGDNTAIGREISGQLGMGINIQPATELFPVGGQCALDAAAAEKIEKANGFAEVFPEHKYYIVKALQDKGHLVAMTGDGVNDAPALKQAEVGIAVSGATNAAQSAAALVLTEPGLGVIIHAVEEARRIFERMNSYTVYRIAMTFSIMVFVVGAMLAYNVFPLTAMMIIILALLDDIPIMTIAYDNTFLSPTPVRWEMSRVLTVSTFLGFLAAMESFLLFFLGRDFLHLPLPQLQTLLFLRLAAGGHLLLFVTRTRKPFFMRPFPSWQLFTAIVGTQAIAVLMCGFGWLVPVLSWRLIGWCWVYIIAWMFFQDICKLYLHAVMENRTAHGRHFFKAANQSLHSHPLR